MSNQQQNLTIQGSQNIFHLLCCIIFAVFFGARYDVGLIIWLIWSNMRPCCIPMMTEMRLWNLVSCLLPDSSLSMVFTFFLLLFSGFLTDLMRFSCPEEESRIFYFLVFTLIFNCTFLSWMMVQGGVGVLLFCNKYYLHVKRRLMLFLLLGIIAISMHKSQL